MKILVLNGSPKGKNSITLQTILFLQKKHPKHDFKILHVGKRIKKYEKDFTGAKQELENAELILFAYPVYTFIAPYQIHRFIELMKENEVDLKNKIATQFSTSKHFYDVTAHKYIEENCNDLGLKYIRGLSADMEDLLCKQGQQDAESFFEHLFYCLENDICIYPTKPFSKEERTTYKAVFKQATKKNNTNVVVVTNCAQDDENLKNMIADFRANLPYPSREVNIREFKFSGGCLGCFGCAVSGKCVYNDGFDDFLRNEIQVADAIVYAFTIQDHYTQSSFKLYDDRQFCNGHRAVTMGIPIAYVISGDYRNEANLQTIVEGRSEVGGNFLAGIATDEGDTTTAIKKLSKSLVYAFEHKLTRPKNFYGVGGTKIFRDLIYLMRGIMRTDHKFYKKNKIYDFPQKKIGTILKMQLIGVLMSLPSVQKKMKGKMNEIILSPYQKVIEAATSEAKNNYG